MKQRFINVLKWFFMILGALFLLQILLVLAITFGFTNFAHADLDFINTDKKIKPIQPIIKYVEDYHSQNGKYPEKIENIKLKNGLDYTYETTKDGNCYTITIKSKKDNLTKQYQYCSVGTKNSSSKSESYIEYSSK